MTLSIPEDRWRETTDLFKEVFEVLLTDENMKKYRYEDYKVFLQNVMTAFGYPTADVTQDIPLEIHVFSPITYEEWTEMYYKELTESKGGVMMRRLDLDSIYKYVLRKDDYVSADIEFHEDIDLYMDENPNVEVLVKRLEEYYSPADLTEVMNRIKYEDELDFVRQDAIEKAKEEGFSNPESVAFEVRNAHITIPLERYAQEHLEDAKNSLSYASAYVRKNFNAYIFANKLVDYQIELTDNPEDEEV